MELLNAKQLAIAIQDDAWVASYGNNLRHGFEPCVP